MMRLAFAAALCASPALADCPTGADLATGIVFETDIGDTDVFTDAGGGVVQIDSVTPDGYGYRTLLAQGVHLLQLSDTEDGQIVSGSLVNTSYPGVPSDLPVPTPGSTWEVETMINSYGDIYAETQIQAWGDMIDFTVGDCTFDGIPGKIRYESDGYSVNEGIMFLPALGMSLLLTYDDDEGPREEFNYTAVRAAE